MSAPQTFVQPGAAPAQHQAQQHVAQQPVVQAPAPHVPQLKLKQHKIEQIRRKKQKNKTFLRKFKLFFNLISAASASSPTTGSSTSTADESY